MFAIHQSELLLEAGTNEHILSILNLLMGKEVELFQSINFLTASQQRTHSDSIHMTTFPYGNLIAIWIALEDITAEDPLHYYPGSHTLPYVMNNDFGNEGSTLLLGDRAYADYEDKIEEAVQQNQPRKETFLAKKGDLLIWYANLLHGGEPLFDKSKTRKSMVFHYYAKDAICFHEITQRPS
ncbi:MAG: phytanoyl-CoA dioxygenase family protein [Bacteroidota bacterium]